MISELRRKSKSPERRPQESGSSSTYKFQDTASSSSNSKRSSIPTATPAPPAPTTRPVVPEKADIIRSIVNPENVKIPRRETEGVRPIFDREELRASIKRRIQTGEHEENLGLPEQRVVAIIR